MEYLKPDVCVAIAVANYRKFISLPVDDHFHFPGSSEISCLIYSAEGESYVDFLLRLKNDFPGMFFVFRPMFSAEENTKQLVWMLVDGHHPGVNVWIVDGTAAWIGIAQ